MSDCLIFYSCCSLSCTSLLPRLWSLSALALPLTECLSLKNVKPRVPLFCSRSLTRWRILCLNSLYLSGHCLRRVSRSNNSLVTFMPRDVSAYINNPAQRRTRVIHFVEAYYSTDRKRRRKFQNNSRPRRLLFCDHPELKYSYSDDSEVCRFHYSGSSDSELSYLLEYSIGRAGYWTSSSPSRAMSYIRLGNGLSSLLTPDFVELLKGRSKVTRRSRARRNHQGYRFRAFVVDPPDDSSVGDFPRQTPTARGRPFSRRTNFSSTFEPKERYNPCTGRSRVRGYQQPRRSRPPRERTPVTERVPARPGRRVSPVRHTVTREPLPRRMSRYHLAEELDREGFYAYWRGPMPRATRRRNAIPRTTTTTFREEYSRYGIPIPARESFSYPERVPEPPEIVRRSPRLYQERRPRVPTCGGGFEERSPRRNCGERWPQYDPSIVEAGYRRSSTAGVRIIERARTRPGGEYILLETRSPRFW